MAGILCCGLYCGATSDKFALTSAGAPGVALGTSIFGRRALEFDTTTTAGQAYAQFTPVANVTVFAFGFRVKLSQLPSALSSICEPVMGSGTKPQIRVDTDGTLRVRWGTGTQTAHPTVLATGVEYWIEGSFDVSGTTYRLKLSVDTGTGPVAMTDSTLAGQTAGSMSSIRMGNVGNTTTVKHAITDIVLGDAAGDLPWNYGRIGTLIPSTDGTHSFTAGDFQDDAAASIATNATTAHLKIDEATMPAAGAAITTSDYLQQAVIRSTGYLEFGFPASGETVAPTIVTAVAAVSAASAATCTYDLKVNDGGTLDSANHRGRFSPAETTIRHGYIPMPTRPNGGGAWTVAALDALKVRWGYSTDVTPHPYLDAILIEYFVPVDPRTGTGETGTGADASTAPTATLSGTTDASSGADSSAQTATAAPTAEAGSGADASTAPTASYASTDAATGTDQWVGTSQATSEAATGSEAAVAPTAALGTSDDPGTGADVANVAPGALIEAGAGVDASTSPVASLTASEAGSGADAWTGTSQATSDVSGVVSESSTLSTQDSVVTGDLGATTDAAALAATTAPTAQTGVGADASTLTAAYASDEGLSIDENPAQVVAVTAAADAGATADAAVLTVGPTVTDAGSALEVALVIQLYTAADVGSGTEELPDIAALLARADAATGAEAAAASALAGVFTRMSTAHRTRPAIRRAAPVRPIVRSAR